ncbi:hypothetical protein MHYP_G00242140 [Metynnis hypsauchen]
MLIIRTSVSGVSPNKISWPLVPLYGTTTFSPMEGHPIGNLPALLRRGVYTGNRSLICLTQAAKRRD